MELNVFTCSEGWLLSPACMIAPSQAVARFSCVSEVLGVMDTRRFPNNLRERVAREVQAQMFAFVETQEGTDAGLLKLVRTGRADDVAGKTVGS